MSGAQQRKATREHYRETPVAGTDLVLYTWAEDTKVHTRISWPPHGIERPIEITLTFSDAEVDLLASAFKKDMTQETEQILVRIGNAVIVQCALLRKMQERDPRLQILPASERAGDNL